MSTGIQLYKKNDELFAHIEGKEDQPVEIVWLRPLTGRGKEVSILGEKEEVTLLSSLDELDVDSRALAEEYLQKFYLMPEVRRIVKTEAAFGTRYWKVETDKGPARFAMKNPFISIRRIGDDEVILRDVIDNTFHIPNFEGLDERSKEEFEKVT
jgi:hypothetical protein